MCGIFGVIPKTQIGSKEFKMFKKLAKYSERRGLDSSGLLYLSSRHANIIKTNSGISNLLSSYNLAPAQYDLLLGHTRLATHGSDSKNNQPLTNDFWTIFHNGIITNYFDFVATNSTKQISDSFSILNQLAKCDYTSSEDKIMNILEPLKGEMSIIMINSEGQIYGYSNVGNLYTSTDDKGNTWLASEPSFLERIGLNDSKQLPLNQVLQLGDVGNFQLSSPILGIDLNENIEIENFGDSTQHDIEFEDLNYRINEIDYKLDNHYCSLCLLPSNFPYIELNNSGVCNYCENWNKYKPKGESALINLLNSKDPTKRVLVNFSGGRDSSFALHYMQKLGFKPIAFTYDWGFISTAARENMAKMCGILNIEHVIVARDLRKTRMIVKICLEAVLKTWDPALIPLLMALDKSYHTESMKIAKERKIVNIIHSDHIFETTYFKSGLMRIKPNFRSRSKGVNFKVKVLDFFKFAFILIKLLLNIDSKRFLISFELLKSTYNYYVRKHNFIHFYDFIDMNENYIIDELRYYDWSSNDRELDTNWRMGDATAPLYNFLYLIMVGYNEKFALQSNFVRENRVDKIYALILLKKSLKVDYLGISIYLNIIGFDAKKFWTIVNNNLNHK